MFRPIRSAALLPVLIALLLIPWGSASAAEKLPEDIQWLTNDTDPVFASPEAKKGGTLHLTLLSFPLTFRVIGPDANNSFRSNILGNQLGLIGLHPNTGRIIPELATHWAYGEDKRTMYFKLDKRARWSDGRPVTADDFAYTLEFMRSKKIIAPWYNDYYSRELEKVTVYDDHTLAVSTPKPVPDLHLRVGINPTPRHFYGELGDDFVTKYNWRIAPNTGPYQIDKKFKKGRKIVFRRKKDWWAADLRYFRNRFNVNKVSYSVVRDQNVAWEYFKKAKIDVFGLTMPKYWHVKSDTSVVKRGYVERLWFFNDLPLSARGMWMNMDLPLFKDPNVRYAFAHGMNLQRVIDKVLRGDYFRLEHGYMGYGPYTNPDIRARRFDLAQVDKYMTASGWARGKDGIWAKGGARFSAEVSYSLEDNTPRLVVLKEEAKKAGIELKLKRLDPAAAYKDIIEKKHQVAWMAWSTSLRPQFWSSFHSANAHKAQTNNITNTDDPEMDRLIDGYRAALEAEERIALSKEIQRRIFEIGAFLPTFRIPYVRQGYWRWWRLPEVPGTKLTDDLFEPFSSLSGGLFWYDKALHDETLKAKKRKRKLGPVTRVETTFKVN